MEEIIKIKEQLNEMLFRGQGYEVNASITNLLISTEEEIEFLEFVQRVKRADWNYYYANATSEAYRKGEKECSTINKIAREKEGRYEIYLKGFKG